MKTNKLLFFVASIVYLSLLTNCSNEAIDNTSLVDQKATFKSEVKTETQNQTQSRTRSGCGEGQTMEIFVEYENDPSFENGSSTGKTFTKDPDADPDTIPAYLNSPFTICQTYNTTCSNVQMWIVNTEEFLEYYDNIPETGTGSGNNGTDAEIGGANDITITMIGCEPVELF